MLQFASLHTTVCRKAGKKRLKVLIDIGKVIQGIPADIVDINFRSRPGNPRLTGGNMKHSLWASTAIQFFILKLNRATPRIARMMKTRAGMVGAGALVLGVSLAVTIPEATLAQQNEEGWTQTNDPVKDPDNFGWHP